MKPLTPIKIRPIIIKAKAGSPTKKTRRETPANKLIIFSIKGKGTSHTTWSPIALLSHKKTKLNNSDKKYEPIHKNKRLPPDKTKISPIFFIVELYH